MGQSYSQRPIVGGLLEGVMAIETPAPGSLVGVARPRTDSRSKVRGATRYVGDRPLAGMLHARIVPSLYAHARIRAIDASRALAVPGVVAILTAADLPIVGLDDFR